MQRGRGMFVKVKVKVAADCYKSESSPYTSQQTYLFSWVSEHLHTTGPNQLRTKPTPAQGYTVYCKFQIKNNAAMSNSESDRIEQQAQKIINFIPGVNLAYNATRGVVYAAKGNGPEVTKSGIAVARGLAGVVGGPVGMMLAGPVGGVLAGPGR
ncbi:UNVERIFIED_CONTAM: hypothetical protein FKN15_049359 [Acipenser sinensis]